MALKFQGGQAKPTSGSRGTQEYYRKIYSAYTRGDLTEALLLMEFDPQLSHIKRTLHDLIDLQGQLRNQMVAVKNGANTPD